MAVTTGKGYFELQTTLTSMIDYNFENYIDIDDDTRFDLATFVMAKGQSKSTGTPEFFAWSGTLTDRTGQVSNTTTYATNATQLYVQSTAGLRVGDILHFPTSGQDGDHIRITSVAAPLNVSDLNTRTAAIATAATFVVLGEAAAFNATSAATSTYNEPSKVTNYTQLIRRAVSWDETELATDVQTKANRMEQKSKWLRMEFRKDLGFTFWFARSSQDTTNAYQTSKGVVEQLANNVTGTNAGGALAYADFTAQLEEIALYSKSSRYEVFHGAKAIGGLAELGETARRGNQGAKDAHGYGGQEVIVSDFSLRMRYDRILHEAGSVYTATAWILDMSQIWLYHLNGKKFVAATGFKTDDGSEIVTTQFKSNCGLAVTWPKRHGWIYGIT